MNTSDDDYPDADADLVAGANPPSRRAALSRERVVAAAVKFIDTDGLAGLTMRRLGETLQVEAMSLYRYVPGREELLDAVVASIFDEMDIDTEVIRTPTDGWPDFLMRLAHGIRRVALAHPNAFPLVASRPPEAPWLRPPLRSLVWVQLFLEGLKQEDVDDAVAVAAYRAFTSFLLGHLLLEVASLGADVGPLDVLTADTSADDRLLDYPQVGRLRSALSEDHAAVEFEEALETLIDRISLMVLETKR